MQTYYTYAPPTPSPGESTTMVPTQTVSPSLTQMPTTGPSDAMAASLGLGVGLFLLGAIVLTAVKLRQRRHQMG